MRKGVSKEVTVQRSEKDIPKRGLSILHNMTSYLAFLDLKAAFDSVPREEICEAFKRKNISKNLDEAIGSTYSDPKGVVRLSGLESTFFNQKK